MLQRIRRLSCGGKRKVTAFPLTVVDKVLTLATPSIKFHHINDLYSKLFFFFCKTQAPV